ncbi:hypothetical protein OIV83_006345 [Microbotryomycetes sp. JL201]|nr:hypothetical protein OIV83_006345 [Microbotryomycetes sp. JL201]
MRIQDNVFFVTGGGSGLGQATVDELIKRGAAGVCVMDFDEDAQDRIIQKYDQKRVLFQLCDVRSENDVKSAIEHARSKWPSHAIGGVVHCGGRGMAGKTVGNDGEPWSLDLYRDIVDINLVGSFNVARLVAAQIVATSPKLPKSSTSANAAASQVKDDCGVIILTSSVSATEGQMGQVGYASSKAGVEGLVLPMARDLARYGIRVVCIAPSLFSTAMGAGTSDKVKQGLLNSTLFPQRFGEPPEFAHLACAIVENTYINGTTIRIDGGSRMSKF